MKTIETTRSRQRQFSESLAKICPDLEIDHQESDWRHAIFLIRKCSWFQKLFDVRACVMKISDSSRGAAPMFADYWKDIKIEVYVEELLAVAEKFGKQYESLSGRKVTVLKQF